MLVLFKCLIYNCNLSRNLMCMPAMVQPQSPHEIPVNLQLSWKKTESPTSKVFTTIMFSKPLCCDVLIFIQVIFNEIDTHIQLVDFKKIERNCLISFRFCSEDLEVWIRFQLWLQKKKTWSHFDYFKVAVSYLRLVVWHPLCIKK